MPNPLSPGQVCYEAAWRAHPDPDWAPADWYDLPPLVQAAWEAAAQAVRDHTDFPPLDLRLEEAP